MLDGARAWEFSPRDLSARGVHGSAALRAHPRGAGGLRCEGEEMSRHRCAWLEGEEVLIFYYFNGLRGGESM